jgi:signal transduction histidine kinase
MRLPIRTRLSLVFAALSAVVVGIASAALLIGFRAELRSAVDERLSARFASMASDPRSAGTVAVADEEFAQFVEPDGSLVTSRGPTERLLPAGTTDELQALRFFDRDVRTLEELVPVRILAGPVRGGGVLVVGLDVEDQAEAVLRLTTLVAIGGPAVLVALAGLGWLLAGSAVRPVERLRAEAAALTAAEPSRRLPVPETGDELQRLAETLNGMLDRIHRALDRERRLVDEASHELRTPLGVVQAELDLALKGPRSREELEDALRSIAQETERLRRLTQDLLVLARSDRGRLPVHRAEVEVTELVEGVAAAFRARASAAGVRIRVSGSDGRARVDGDRLRQALSNLLDNALRHTGRGGTIDVEAQVEGGRLRVVVTDQGGGFDAAVLDRAFEPFARADDDRAADGAGLGLAIVRAVAEAHGGSATARNLEGGGASVSIEVPV